VRRKEVRCETPRFLRRGRLGPVRILQADLDAFQEPAQLPGRQAGPTDFNAYLRIGADGRVTCFVGKVELGRVP